MDEAEGKKRIAFWESKRKAYVLKGKTSGIARADATIARIKAAMKPKKKEEIKRNGAIVESEHKTSYKPNKSQKDDKGDEK